MRPDWLTTMPIAHRGLWDTPDHPENSLAAFRRAASLGVPFELDVQFTADGQLAVVHDANLERLTGERRRVADLDLAALRRLRVLGTGELIPTLGEVLEVADGTPFVIDVRRWQGAGQGGLEKAVAVAVRGYQGPFAVQSFDPLAVFRLRRLVNDHPVGQASGHLHSAGRTAALFGRAMITNAFTRPAFISFELSALPSAWAGFWRRLGIPVVGWTVRSAAAEKRAAQLADNFFFDGYLPSVYGQRPPSRLLAYAAVDAFAEEIGVAVVAGVLLDHVDEELPEGDWLARTVLAHEVEVVVADELIRERDLLTPGLPGLLNDRLVRHGAVEVTVWILRALIELALVTVGEAGSEPHVLDLGHVADQSEQGHRGRFDRPAGHLLSVQAGALQLQGEPLAAEELG
jgi:glycerophosphoryl diester phosphodiesterase